MASLRFDQMSPLNPIRNNLDYKDLAVKADQKSLKGENVNAEVTQLAQHILKTIPELQQGIGTSKTNEFRDEATKILQSEALKVMLRQKLGLLQEGDLVCELSQGSISELGRAACSYICAEAVQLFLDGKPIKTEEEMYNAIKRGIENYQRFNEKGIVEFSQTLDKTNTLRAKNGNPPLEKIFPENLPGVDPENLQMMKVTDSPFQAELPASLMEIITFMSKLSQTEGKRMCGVFTCRGETIVIAFNSAGNPILFDSHGRTYKGVSKGASVLQFNSIKDLTNHIINTFSKEKYYEFIIVTTPEKRIVAPPAATKKEEKLTIDDYIKKMESMLDSGELPLDALETILKENKNISRADFLQLMGIYLESSEAGKLPDDILEKTRKVTPLNYLQERALELLRRTAP